MTEKKSYEALFHFNDGVSKKIQVGEGEYLLDAAERQGIFLQSSCRNGVCGNCRSNCSSGDVKHDSAEALSTSEREKGTVLSCQLKQSSDASFNFSYSSEATRQRNDQTWAATVTACETLSDGAARLRLSINNPARFDYSAGQFADIRIPGTESWRSYSFANLPTVDNEIEFIIRLLPQGLMSDYLRQRVEPGDELALSSAQGHFKLGPVTRPVVLIAGGTGISAILAMLRQLVLDKVQQPVSLYYGAASVEELLLLDTIKQLGQQLAQFEFYPLPQSADKQWHGQSGLVTDILTPERLHRGDSDVYACGPPPMVKAIEDWLVDRKLHSCQLHMEKFLPSQRDQEVAAAPKVYSHRIGENIQPRGKKHRHAIVIGGSFAGMTAARVLQDSFDRVTIIEQDSHHPMHKSRSNVSQGWHVHHLLQGGQTVMEKLFPNFEEVFIKTGGIKIDSTWDHNAFMGSSWKVIYKSGVPIFKSYRPILDATLRRLLLDYPAIEFRYNTRAEDIELDAEVGISHLHLKEGSKSDRVSADLIVDASGKGSRFPAMFKQHGLGEAEETRLELDIYYHSCVYKIPANKRPKWSSMLIYGDRPYESTGAYAGFYGHDKTEMLVSHMQMGGAKPMANLSQLEQALGLLPQPHIADMLEVASPVREMKVFCYPAMFRRHYERWKQIPANYLAVGDALGSADPVSGAGMTKAALECDALAAALDVNDTLSQLAPDYYRRTASLSNHIWMVLSEMNLRFDWVKGKRPVYTPLLNWYVNQLQDAAHYNSTAYEHLLQVMHLNRRWPHLLKPAVLIAVANHSLLRGWRHKYMSPHLGQRREQVVIQPNGSGWQGEGETA